MKGLTFIFLASILLLWSCNKEDNAIVDFEEFNECHELLGLDSLAIESSLIGTWAWDFSHCAFDLEQDCKGLSIEFDSNKNLILSTNDGQTQTAHWKLVRFENTFWVETDTFVSKTDGVLLFCEDRILFSNIFSDGCDNYFKRK